MLNHPDRGRIVHNTFAFKGVREMRIRPFQGRPSMGKVMLLLGLFFLVSCSTSAQNLSRAEIFGGYDYTNTHSSNGDKSSYNGGSVDVAGYISNWMGMAGDFGRSTSNGYTDSTGTHNVATSSSIHYLFGPRFRFGTGRVTPFIEILVGGVQRSALVGSNGATLVNAQTSFGISAGGGFDVRVTQHIAIRPIDVALLSTWFSPATGVHNSQDDVNISTGIVFRWN
jgi:hypothetical protein